MPLPSPDPSRQLRHTRSITVVAYTRADGCLDLDAHITDIKAQDAHLSSGVRPAGVPIHDLWLRITIDSQLVIVAAVAAADDIPFPGFCAQIHPSYQQKLIGKSLRQGFRQALQADFGGVLGCTHLTELAQILPTAAIQALAGDKRTAENEARRPFHIDQCNAMRADGEAVARFYPRWMKPPVGAS